MKRKKTFLCVEQLEDRWVPAAISLSQGNLTIGGTIAGAIAVTQNAAGNFNVTEGGRNQGTYAVTGNLTIDTTHSLMPGGADVITVTLANGQRLNGNLTINSGTGNDTITVNGTGGEGAASRIGGIVNIDSGLGNDSINIGTGGGLRVGGLLQLNGNLGINTITIGNATAGATTLSGDATISNVQDLIATGAAFSGNLSINDATTTTSNFISLDAATTVGKALSINGGSGADNVTLSGTVNGTTGVNLGNGANVLTVNASALFAQSFTYTGGSAGDTVTLGAATFDGNVSLNLGDGNNIWNLASAFTVSGSMTLTIGNGNNTFGAFEGIVSGNLTISVGNGTNNFFLDGAGTAFVAGTVTYTSGTGDNTFQVSTNGETGFTLHINFNTGDDTFTLTTPADAALLTGYVNWGDDVFGNDTLNDAGGTFTQNWQFRGVQ